MPDNVPADRLPDRGELRQIMQLLRPADVAGQLCCGLANVYALIDSGQLPAVRIGAAGGGIRVTQDALCEFIESRQIMTPVPKRPAKAKPRRTPRGNWF